jgi:DNA-directed RNA polymerase specialized sigma subunit
MLFIDDYNIDLMDEEKFIFEPSDYEFNFNYSKKLYPLLGLSNIDLIVIIKEMLNSKKSYKEIENVKMTLLISNLKLINWTIRTFYPNNDFDKEELQYIGLDGLMYAIERFNYNYVVGFSKYAVIAIRNSIRHKFRQVSDIPYYAYYDRLELLDKKELLEQKYGREISLEELAHETNMNLKRVKHILSKEMIKEPYYDEQHTNKDDTVYSVLEMQDKYDISLLIICALPEKRREIYLNIVNNSLTREELCKKYNLSMKTISMYYQDVCSCIRYYMENKDVFITGNNQLYRILIELIKLYRVQYDLKDYNDRIRQLYCNYEDIEIVIKIVNKLIEIFNRHLRRDIEFITYMCFKKYKMLLDYSFLEEFFDIYSDIIRRDKDKRKINRKK